MDYKQAIKYLESFINYERKPSYAYKAFKLKRIEKLLERLGNPHKQFKSIHVAGTKGKGSTCAAVHFILKEAGYKVGLYTSPHLVDFRERIRIGDKLISKKDVCKLLSFMKPHIEKQNNNKKLGKLTFFEVYTALAFLYFAKQKIDYAVVEVGLGGRLDATNVLTPEVCGITHIGLDHMQILGNTVEKIAKEKAGIIKEGCPVVCQNQKQSVLNIIIGKCRKKHADLFIVGRDLKYKSRNKNIKGQEFDLKGLLQQYKNLKTNLLGLHQLENVSCAIGIVEILSQKGAKIGTKDVKNAIKNINWPGRLQIFSKKPLVILDGAHNKSSAQALKKTIKSIFPHKEIILIFAIFSDKDIKGVVDTLFPIAKKIILTKSKNPRAASIQRLKIIFEKYKNKMLTRENSKDALLQARLFSRKNDIILITGSFYLIGEILASFQKQAFK